jgi:hypothetical protein
MAAAEEFTTEDFKEFSNIYAGEFNRPEMHDRVLVLDVFSDNAEDETNPVCCAIKHEKQRLSDDNAVDASPCSSVCTRAMSKANATQDTVANLDASFASTGKRKLSVKRKASSDKMTTLRSRKISVGDQHKIFAHSSWLSVHSKYFRALFYSGLKESHLKEVHLRIPKSEEAAHLHLIEAMYSLDVLNNLPARELVLILVLADKYDAKFVFRKCKYVLKTKVDSVKLCEEIFNAIKLDHHIVDVEDLVETIQTFLAKAFSPLDEKWESYKFENLPEHLIALLLSSDNLMVSCEDVVFHALMRWIKNNLYNLKDISKILPTSPLLSVIRFPLLTTSYLLSVVQHHPIAKQMPNFNDYYLKAINLAATPSEVVYDMPEDATKVRINSLARIVHFRWKMPRKEVLKASAKLYSEPFWACGYKMQLSLLQKTNYADEFFVVITLKILSLKEGGFTSVEWHIRYNGKNIVQDEDYDDFVFTTNNPERSKDCLFTWTGHESCVLQLIMRPFDTAVDFQ